MELFSPPSDLKYLISDAKQRMENIKIIEKDDIKGQERLIAIATDKLQVARTRLTMNFKFYSVLISYLPDYLQFYWDFPDGAKCYTAYTDFKRIVWAPEFVDALTPAEIPVILMHEIHHVAFNHMQRRASRDPLLWNVATDLNINFDILNSINELGNSIKKREPILSWRLMDTCLIHKDYIHDTAEIIYNNLKNQLQCPACNPKNDKSDKGGQSQGQGDADDQQNGQGQGDSDQEDDQNQGQKGSDQQDGQDGDSQQDKDEKGNGKENKPSDKGGKNGSPQCTCGKQHSGQDDKDMSDEAKKKRAQESIRRGQTSLSQESGEEIDENGESKGEKQEREWTNRIVSAAHAQMTEVDDNGNIVGSLPSSLRRLVEHLLEPKVDWRAALESVIKTAITKNDYSWSRPSYRTISQGIYLPSLYDTSVAEGVVIVDDSGSCYNDVQQFISETVAIFKQYPSCKLHLVRCDAVPEHVCTWSPDEGDDPEFTPKVEVNQGGGTSFVLPFSEFIPNQEWKPDFVVYLTDLDGPLPGPEHDPMCDVLWVVNNRRHSKDELPFGHMLYLNG